MTLGNEISRRDFLRGSAVAVAGVATGVAAAPVLWRQPSVFASVPPAAARLAFGPDPATQAVVSWSTAGSVADPRVRVLHGGEEVAVVAASSAVVASTTTLYHHAPVGGLVPGTAYTYEILQGGSTFPGSVLTTAPAATSPQPFTFTAFGDQGVSDKAVAINGAVAAQHPAFHFHVGDLCYAYNAGTGGIGSVNPLTWDNWLNQISPIAASTPWMVSVGNHEMEPGYGDLGYDGVRARLAIPTDPTSGSPVVYAFRYGNVAVLALDANDLSYEIDHQRDYSGGAQDVWLDVTLTALREDPAIDWIVAGFHHCAYCSNVLHGSDGAIRDQWEPLFDEHGVDLVINGHNHSFERSHPMRAGEVQREVHSGGVVSSSLGTTYVTAGCGGNPRVEVSTAPASFVVRENGIRVPELATWSAFRYLDLSFLAVDVTPRDENGRTTMRLRAVKPDGTELERVTLTRE